MSSENKMKQWEVAALISGMLLMTVWYAWPQLIYSLFIGYDLGQLLAPEIMGKALVLFGFGP